VRNGVIAGQNDFRSAAATDRVLAMIREDASRENVRASRTIVGAREVPPRRGIGAALRALRVGS
jgi:hypothetical protein